VKRRLAVRIGLLLLYAGLIALTFVTGKGHTILIDNKDTESAEGIAGVLGTVNGGEEIELYRGDRDKAVVRGQSHRVRIELFDDGTVVEKRIRLPIGKDVLLLSLPALLAGQEPALFPFVAPRAAPPPQEEEPESSEGAVEYVDVLPEALPEASPEALPEASPEAPSD